VETTWDGMPVARENPTAVAIVIWRRAAGGREFLIPRELREETGLELAFEPLPHETDGVALFVAEAPGGAQIVLEAEHDRFEWVTLDEGLARCLPAIVGRGLELADAWAERGASDRR
jgi:hypothetical protein